MEDSNLYRYAKQELGKISEKEQPFAFYMLTVDTHNIGGYVCPYCDNNYENQFSTYDGMEGFSYDVDIDNDTEYRIIYEIDMQKINDNDLANFNIGRDFSTFQTDYEDLGYTCK